MTEKPIRSVAQLACLLAVVLALVALTVQDHAPAATAPQSQAQAPAHTRTPPAASRPPRAEPDPAVVTRRVEDRVRARLREVSERAHVAVSVRDDASESRFDYGSGRFATASLVKVHFVALMLWRAERSGAGLTPAQRQDVRAMLLRSENDPANRAYTALGGPAGIERGLENAFGSSRIQVGDQFRWGGSTTKPRAVVALLDRVLDPKGARTYAPLQRDMARVIPELRWGISVLADRGKAAQVKVGFVEHPDGWVVNSSGRVIVDDAPVLISVMSDRNATLEAGIATVEKVARLAGDVVRAERAERAVRAAQQEELPLLSLLRRNAVQVG